MKKIIICLCAVLVVTHAFAQDAAKVPAQETFNYNRCSITVLPLLGFTSLDGATQQWATDNTFDGKFDLNKIQTNYVRTDNDNSSIKSVLEKENVAKQVLNYWLQYNGQYFYPTLMEQRSRYNATDADVQKDAASAVSTLLTNGRALMNNSYIMVAGPTSLEEKTDKKGNKTYTTKASAYVYQVDLNDTIMASLNNMWLREGMDEAKQFANKQQYDNLGVKINFVASVNDKIGVGSSAEESLNEALAAVLQPLEKKIDKWQVVTTIFQEHPLRAKIGKKEGVKNSDRYAAYKVLEDEAGNVEFKRVGYVRATTIADNNVNADGEMSCSKFYQIAGWNLREGYYLKQKKDCKMSLSGEFGALGPYIGRLNWDMLIHTSQTFGIMQYAGLTVGYGRATGSGDDANYLGVEFNYGVGIHPIRIIEIEPYLGIGADYFMEEGGSSSDEAFTKHLGYFAEGGVKIGVQIFYPLQIFVRGGYSYLFSKGDSYIEAEDRFNAIEVSAGLRFSF